MKGWFKRRAEGTPGKHSRAAVAGSALGAGLLVGAFGLISVTGSQTVGPTDPVPTSPTTTPTTPAPGGTGAPWPSASTTGVPAGTTLTAYSGPMTITANNTVIDSKTINGCIEVQATNVTITKTQINGCVVVDESGDLEITDTRIVNDPNAPGTGLEWTNYVATRVHITGGNRSAYCKFNCTIIDSYVHGQYTDTGCATRIPSACSHESGIRMEQNTTLIHNTILCDAGYIESNTTSDTAGCSGSLTGYGDFEAIQNNLIQNNYFPALTESGSTCAYGGASAGKPYSGQDSNIRFIDNVFERSPSSQNGQTCGYFFTVVDFNPNRPGNVFTGNVYTDGSPVNYS